MSKAASLDALQELHRNVAKSLNDRITQDMEDKLPTDAATLGAAIKFLKDNNVSADPAASDDLDKMREALTKQMRERSGRRGNVVALATADLKVMEG